MKIRAIAAAILLATSPAVWAGSFLPAMLKYTF